MLDTSLTWEIAKEQCGKGTEDVAQIEPNDDAVLYVALWNAYRAYLPNIHANTGVLIPFIENQDLDYDNMYESNISQVIDSETQHKGNFLYNGLEDRFLIHVNGGNPVLTDELFRNAFAIGMQSQKPIHIRSYIGENGVASAAEQNGYMLDINTVLQMHRRGNRGKGWPLLLEEKKSRIGIETIGEKFRTMIVQTVADQKNMLTPYAENKGHTYDPKYTIDGATVWKRYISSIIDATRASCLLSPLAYQKHPPHKQKRTSKRKIYEDEIVEEYREQGWERVRQIYEQH